MDKYRKLYNKNFLGTSDVSILKFYYASFKLQQQTGKISDVGRFLDECIEVAADRKIFQFKLFLTVSFLCIKMN